MHFVDIPCDNCGKTFRKAKSQHKLFKRHFCSRDCQYAYGIVTLSCAQCGQPFTVRRSMSANRQYCSIRCAHDAETIHRKICPTCGKEFIHQTKTHCSLECRINPTYAWTSCPECGKEFRYYRKYPRKYCSRECSAVNNAVNNLGVYERGKPSVLVPCDKCGKEFLKLYNQYRATTSHFCSRACFHEWSKENAKTGEDAPTWKGGYEPYYGANWRKQRRKARERDDHTCQRCGITEIEHGRALDVHHIVPFRRFGRTRYKEANDLSNLICLCNVCHTFVEHNGL